MKSLLHVKNGFHKIDINEMTFPKRSKPPYVTMYAMRNKLNDIAIIYFNSPNCVKFWLYYRTLHYLRIGYVIDEFMS